MPSLTPNLSLTTYNNTTDQSGSFVTWLHDMSGSSNSNMTKIDNWSGSASGSITNLSSILSGSMTDLTTQMSAISGSLVNLTASVASLQLRLKKIDEFDGVGQADFDDIPQDFTHLLIMGVAASSRSETVSNLGCDFNGDANLTSYKSLAWGIWSVGSFESFSEALHADIRIGGLPGTTSYGYGSPVFAIIPNYSADGGFYKLGMGYTTYHLGGTWFTSGMQGGVWLYNSPITRVRIFATVGSTTRFNFVAGTKLTLYGFG
jgi:hypothetical protein